MAPAAAAVGTVILPDPIKVKCQYCPRWVSKHDARIIGESVIMCWRCYEERHRPALHGLKPPKECSMCHTPTEVLAAMQPGGRLRMFIHFTDGVYALMCPRCSDEHVLKRQDLYRKTRYGYERGV